MSNELDTFYTNIYIPPIILFFEMSGIIRNPRICHPNGYETTLNLKIVSDSYNKN